MQVVTTRRIFMRCNGLCVSILCFIFICLCVPNSLFPPIFQTVRDFGPSGSKVSERGQGFPRGLGNRVARSRVLKRNIASETKFTAQTCLIRNQQACTVLNRKLKIHYIDTLTIENLHWKSSQGAIKYTVDPPLVSARCRYSLPTKRACK